MCVSNPFHIFNELVHLVAEETEFNCTNDESVQNTPLYPPGVIGYFPGYQTPENIIYWWIADYTCDAIYLADIFLVKRRVQFINNGLLEVV
jgi:hypothetical protein